MIFHIILDHEDIICPSKEFIMGSHEYEILSESFMHIIVAIHRNFFRQMKLPLPINQFSVLKVLENEGPLTSRDLGEVLSISNS